MAPTGINRPGYSSSKAPTGINRPGYSSSKAPTGINRPGYSKPEKDKDRSRRREQQEKEERDFIQSLKIAPGTTNLLQEQAPVFNPMTGKYERTTLADKRIQLANKYGPTFREILGDVGSGIGSIAGGLGDFIARGGVTGSVLSNIYNKFKSGARTGIETVGGLYDNLRSAFSGQPTVTYGGSSSISTTSGGQPRVDLTPTSITTEALSPMDLNRNIGDESDPSIFGIENPLFNQQVYDPIRVSDMDITGLTAQNLIDPTRVLFDPSVRETIGDYATAAAQGVDVNTPIGKLNLNPLVQKVFLDGGIGDVKYGGFFDPNTSDYNVGISKALPGDFRLSAGASSSDLPGVSLSNTYLPKIFGTDIPVISNVTPSLNMSRQGDLNLGVNTIIDPLKTIFPGSAVGVPINVGASVDPTGRITPNIGLAVPFKNGGSVDKYAGLGYKLK